MQQTIQQDGQNDELVALKGKLTTYLQKWTHKTWKPFDTQADGLIIVDNKKLFVRFKAISEGLQHMEVPYIEFMLANGLKEEDLG